MKTREFQSFEDFETSGIAGMYEIVSVVKYPNKIAADLTTECKTYKTALNRFFKAIKDYPALAEWAEGIYESCENGYFEAVERGAYIEDGKLVTWNGIWHWHVEHLYDDLWYIELTTEI